MSDKTISENAIVIERNGSPLTLYIERGPLGLVALQSDNATKATVTVNTTL